MRFVRLKKWRQTEQYNELQAAYENLRDKYNTIKKENIVLRQTVENLQMELELYKRSKLFKKNNEIFDKDLNEKKGKK